MGSMIMKGLLWTPSMPPTDLPISAPTNSAFLPFTMNELGDDL